MTSAIRRFLSEPRPESAPQRVWRDPVVVAGFMVALVVELSIREIPWRLLFFLVMVPLPVALLFRRTQPLLAIAAFIVPLSIFDVALAIGGHQLPDVFGLAFGLILIYAAFRWGSGKEAIWAAILLIGGALLDFVVGFATLGNTIAGFAILALTAETGVIIRRNKSIRDVMFLNARSREREQLARELHDTVAHHVSAIAVQAQAGRAVFRADPDMAERTFDAIEESASRALDEMRVVVGALRDEAPLVPNRGIEHLEELAVGLGARVSIERHGDSSAVNPMVSSALYRLVQESITNARRHSPDATEIRVSVTAGPSNVHMAVVNDGALVTQRSDYAGFGLVGMEERATLLGGTFNAGPLADGGWLTEADLPTGSSRRGQTS